MFPPTMIMRSTTILMTALALAGCGSATIAPGGGETGSADLTITSVTTTPGKPVVGGEPVTVTVVVANTGDKDAAACDLTYTFKGTPLTLGLPAVAAGEDATVTFQLTSATTGGFLVEIAVDTGGDVAESEETDNSASGTVTWVATDDNFDLVDVQMVDATPVIGTTAQVRFKVSCQWESISGAFLSVGWRIVRVDDPEVALASSADAVAIDSTTTDYTLDFTDPDGVGAVQYRLELDYVGFWGESAELDNVEVLNVTWVAPG